MLETIQSMLSFLPAGIVEFLMAYVVPVLIIVAKILVLVLPLMGAVAYLTLAERKVIGYIQVRIGPNRVGFFGYSLWGLGQPIADAVKLLFKETIFPTKANTFLFLSAPIISLAPALHIGNDLTGSLWGNHRRMGFKLKICVLRGITFCGANCFL